MHFLTVYIRETHPEDGWIIAENRRSGLAVDDPTTDDERRAVATDLGARILLFLAPWPGPGHYRGVAQGSRAAGP